MSGLFSKMGRGGAHKTGTIWNGNYLERPWVSCGLGRLGRLGLGGTLLMTAVCFSSPTTAKSIGSAKPIAQTQAASHITSSTCSGFPLKQNVELLDGGTGEELFRRGVPDDREIWSAVAVVNSQHHATLVDVHRSFIQAGSRYVSVNNYAITPGTGFEEERLSNFTQQAAELAVRARDLEIQAGTQGASDVLICGSLPPLVESYRPDKVMEHSDGVRVYGRIVKALQPHVDLFLAETLSSIEEMAQAFEAAKVSQKPVFASWTLRGDGKLRSGESVTAAITALLAQDTADLVKGILFNCAEPEAIAKALAEINSDQNAGLLLKLQQQEVKLGAYANRLVPLTDDQWEFGGAPQPMRKDLTPDDYFGLASDWVKHSNVRLVGGCCGIGPEYISRLKEGFSTLDWLKP